MAKRQCQIILNNWIVLNRNGNYFVVNACLLYYYSDIVMMLNDGGGVKGEKKCCVLLSTKEIEEIRPEHKSYFRNRNHLYASGLIKMCKMFQSHLINATHTHTHTYQQLNRFISPECGLHWSNTFLFAIRSIISYVKIRATALCEYEAIIGFLRDNQKNKLCRVLEW